MISQGILRYLPLNFEYFLLTKRILFDIMLKQSFKWDASVARFIWKPAGSSCIFFFGYSSFQKSLNKVILPLTEKLNNNFAFCIMHFAFISGCSAVGEQIKTIKYCFYRCECAETRSKASRVYRGDALRLCFKWDASVARYPLTV